MCRDVRGTDGSNEAATVTGTAVCYRRGPVYSFRWFPYDNRPAELEPRMSGTAVDIPQHDKHNARVTPLLLSTARIPKRKRHDWLHEAIGRHYANVAISTPKRADLFNEMSIYPWGEGQFSFIRSNPIRLQRSADLTRHPQTDAVFFIMLLNGAYRLRQDGREVDLKAGDISMYDVRRPHVIDCPERFSKLVIKVPGPVLRARLPSPERYTALRIPAATAIGAIARGFFNVVLHNIPRLRGAELDQFGLQSVDLLASAMTGCHPLARRRSHTRAGTLTALKTYIAAQLHNPELSAGKIAAATGYSNRYANELMRAEGTSLMRYVWSRRLESSRDMLDGRNKPDLPVAEIAFRCGFSDPAHFSRAFKQKFGMSPRAYRNRHDG